MPGSNAIIVTTGNETEIYDGYKRSSAVYQTPRSISYNCVGETDRQAV